MNEATKKFMTMSIWFAILIFVIRCWIGWNDITTAVEGKNVFTCGYSLFCFAGETIGITAMFMACFNKWFWKWKPLNWMAGGMPVLEKQYKGVVRFRCEDVEQERNSELKIVQTFLNVTVKLGTIESSSDSVTAAIETINNEMQLVYTYLNTPRAEIQDRSAIHYGTAMLRVDNPKHLIGNYYTGRLSRGSMDFQAVEK